MSELFGNSVRHSRSGAAGGTVTVAVSTEDGLVRVEVTDRSGPEVPELHRAGRMRKAAGGFSSLRAWRRGGGGGGVAGGRSVRIAGHGSHRARLARAGTCSVRADRQHRREHDRRLRSDRRRRAAAGRQLPGGTLYASQAGSGTESSLSIQPGGAVTLLGATPTDAGTVDAAASPDGRYLYVQAGGPGTSTPTASTLAAPSPRPARSPSPAQSAARHRGPLTTEPPGAGQRQAPSHSSLARRWRCPVATLGPPPLLRLNGESQLPEHPRRRRPGPAPDRGGDRLPVRQGRRYGAEGPAGAGITPRR